MLTLSQKDVP